MASGRRPSQLTRSVGRTFRKEWTEVPVAQFRREPGSERWRLYCADRHSRWHAYQGIKPAKSLTTLLAEVDRDPTGIFWG